MQRDIYEKTKEKLDFIKKTEKPYGILLVGSSRKILEEPYCATSDIDVFVIKKSGDFEREVVQDGEVEYDISYISCSDLEYAIENQLGSVLSVLSNSEPVYMSEEANDIVSRVVEAYDRGPEKKPEDQIRYGRFRLTKSLETVIKRLDSVEFDFLVHNYLSDLLCFYYESRGDWTPSEKRLVKSIEDVELRGYVEALLMCSEREIKLKSLERVADYVMDPLGGKLYDWDKSEYPFDFK